MRLIDADALEKKFKEMGLGEHSLVERVFADGVFAIIENAPTVDAVPVVRGKWRPYSPLTDTYECDKCGYQVIDDSFCTNFCPNCGADMDGGVNDGRD